MGLKGPNPAHPGKSHAGSAPRPPQAPTTLLGFFLLQTQPMDSQGEGSRERQGFSTYGVSWGKSGVPCLRRHSKEILRGGGVLSLYAGNSGLSLFMETCLNVSPLSGEPRAFPAKKTCPWELIGAFP